MAVKSKIEPIEITICNECAIVVANADFSGMTPERIAEVEAGLEHAGGYVVSGDSDKWNEFSSEPCDLCNTYLAGSRHQAFIHIVRHKGK